ncbi:hypothetical protein [Flavobacterium restrictum]|uniref:Uncharacterized protein n=1 Tax=Flavobacterium restrictum TaxID=2594428 RepID=A0A553DN06_9FLAO|nr:hypothetical protein [Flavobacterium restrictum]TRX34087.1 hypothetical protein FNW21_15990 [Flavobacterium restrictum]
MDEYFKNVDLIIQNKINKMPLKRDTLDKAVAYLKTYNECIFEIQDELRDFFNEYTKTKPFSETEISAFNIYNRKSIEAFVEMFMKK